MVYSPFKIGEFSEVFKRTFFLEFNGITFASQLSLTGISGASEFKLRPFQRHIKEKRAFRTPERTTDLFTADRAGGTTTATMGVKIRVEYW